MYLIKIKEVFFLDSIFNNSEKLITRAFQRNVTKLNSIKKLLTKVNFREKRNRNMNRI